MREKSIGEVGWFLIIVFLFVIVGTLLYFVVLLHISVPLGVALMGALLGSFFVWLKLTFRPLDVGASLKLYEWSTFRTGYYTGDEWEDLQKMYNGRPPMGDNSPEKELRDRYCKRSFLASVGFGDWAIVPYPIYAKSRLATTARLRIPIKEIKGLITKDVVADYDVDGKTTRVHFPSVSLSGDSELILSLGPDFGRVQRKFSQGDFSTREGAQKALADLEPDVLDALQKGVGQFVWVPRGSPINHPDNILHPENRKKLEKYIRRELRSERDNTFVVAGFLQFLEKVNGEVPLVDPSEDIGLGASLINIPLENLEVADARVKDASNEAAIAAAEANATAIRMEGYRRAADKSGVDIEVIIGEMIMKKSNIQAVFLGDLTAIDLARRAGGKPQT